eukprot:XP_014789758.1 PREDICTED: rho guanine nucleotide exchange factor 7-like isoform X2 [Octopus bimaculoides]
MLTQAKTAKMTQPPLQTKMYKTWSMSCLRPAPPMRPSASERDALKSPRSGRKPGMRRKPERSHSEDEYDYRWKRYDPVKSEDDQIILRVIEAYCTSAKTRQTVNSLDLAKLRLKDNANVDSSANGDQLISPDNEEYHVVQGRMMRGFCCASFPLAKGLARTIKRL